MRSPAVVGHFLPGVRIGTGTGEATAGLIRGLAARGISQVLISPGPIELSSELRAKIQVRPVRRFGSGRMAYPILKTTTTFDVGLLVIHGGWSLPLVVAARWAKRSEVPYLIMTHGVYDRNVVARHSARKRLWMSALERRYVRQASAVHCYFTEEYESLAAELGESPPPHIATPSAVEMPPVVWTGQDSDYVLWMGRFDVENKGLDLLLEALALLRESDRPLLRLHGKGPEKGKRAAQRIVERLRLQRWVKIGGFLSGPEKWRTLSEARAYVFPSRWEAFGMALAEAVGVGVPTVATPVPLANYFAERGAVRLAESTPDGIAEALTFVLSTNCQLLSHRGREIVASDFGPEAVADQWLMQLKGHGLL